MIFNSLPTNPFGARLVLNAVTYRIECGGTPRVVFKKAKKFANMFSMPSNISVPTMLHVVTYSPYTLQLLAAQVRCRKYGDLIEIRRSPTIGILGTMDRGEYYEANGMGGKPSIW